MSNLDFKQGLGIALVAAQRAGVPVTLVDNSDKSLSKGLAFAGMSLLAYPDTRMRRFIDGDKQTSC